MVNMTLAIPDKLNQVMKFHSEIKWSEIARRSLWEHAHKLELMDKLVANSKFNEKNVEDIGEKIKAGLHKRHFR